tara:strand:- start:2034 stop:2222 length:189 start_codon:yes stop_codon:yes gene_type:complete
MARKKKVESKREKIFDFVSKTIDFIQAKWKLVFLVLGVTIFIYVVFFWLDTVQEIRFEIIYF